MAGLVTAWLRVAAGHQADAAPGCAARAVCQANWEAGRSGGRDTAELGTLVLASRLPRLPRLPPAPDIVWAGRLGRKYLPHRAGVGTAEKEVVESFRSFYEGDAVAQHAATVRATTAAPEIVRVMQHTK